MIATVRGTLLEKSPGACVIEAAGVGYAISISAHTSRALPEVGAEAFLRTRQIVREDALMLFGFSGADELRLFDLVIGVSGVGPRLALALLSGLEPHVLVRAIREEQIGALVSVPGIGKKTAERLVVELRDRIEPAGFGVVGASARETSVLPRSQKFEDAVAALTRLGYTQPQAQDAVRRVSEESKDVDLEHLVRRALSLLSRPAVSAR